MLWEKGAFEAMLNAHRLRENKWIYHSEDGTEYECWKNLGDPFTAIPILRVKREDYNQYKVARTARDGYISLTPQWPDLTVFVIMFCLTLLLFNVHKPGDTIPPTWAIYGIAATLTLPITYLLKSWRIGIYRQAIFRQEVMNILERYGATEKIDLVISHKQNLLPQ